jgi:pimeloyl-ACP methyl ester carboxylesterase
MSDAATILLVHGAWHDSRCFAPLVDALGRRGITATAIDRPGHGASTEPLGDLTTDAAATRAALAAIDGPVVLVGHSYGGAVISEAGDASNVVRLVYLCALVLAEGESCGDAGSRDGVSEGVGADSELMAPGTIEFHDDGTVTVDPAVAPRAFYHDCDPATTATAVAQLQPQSAASLTTPATRAAWKHTPSTYVVCADDRAISPSLQRFLAQRCTDVIELAASHSPFLSMPDRLANELEAIARAAAVRS